MHDANAHAAEFAVVLQKADAVVFDAEEVTIAGRFERDEDIFGFAMFDGIADGFEDDVVEMSADAVVDGGGRIL